MKIIMLKGPGSCGKTTTLNLVYAELILAGAAIKTARKQVGEKLMDFEAVLSYTQRGKTKRVAIYSMGDILHKVMNAIIKYAKIGVDVLIIALNKSFVKKPYKQEDYPDSPSPVEKNNDPPKTMILEDLRIARKIIDLI